MKEFLIGFQLFSTWFINDFLQNITKWCNSVFTNKSDLIDITFGLIAAVLTLVGLLSIFISINSQHNIQKCREIFWSLLEQRDSMIIIRKLALYHDIINNSESFTPRVIGLIKMTIMWVIIISSLLIVSLSFCYTIIEGLFILFSDVIIIIIFWKFSNLLKDINNFERISDLPPVKKLLDGTEESRISTISLLAYTSNMELQVFDNSFRVALRTYLPFRNVEVYVTKVTIWSNNNILYEWQREDFSQTKGYKNITHESSDLDKEIKYVLSNEMKKATIRSIFRDSFQFKARKETDGALKFECQLYVVEQKGFISITVRADDFYNGTFRKDIVYSNPYGEDVLKNSQIINVIDMKTVVGLLERFQDNEHMIKSLKAEMFPPIQMSLDESI